MQIFGSLSSFICRNAYTQIYRYLCIPKYSYIHKHVCILAYSRVFINILKHIYLFNSTYSKAYQCIQVFIGIHKYL